MDARFCAQLLRTSAGRYVSRGLWGHALSPSLRFATKILYEIMLLGFLCTTKPSNRALHGAVLLAPASMQVRFCASWLGFRSCFGDFCCFSYFLPGLFRLLGCVWGAVLGISAVSATFCRVFIRLLGWGWELVWGFLLFQLLFAGSLSGFWAGFGVLFWGFLLFQLLFLGFFPAFGLGLGAVLGISAVSATFCEASGIMVEAQHHKLTTTY